MATIRVRKTKDFSIVSNVLLRDKRLSLRARGLLVFMLSLSDTWEYSIAGLANATGESTGKISTCLKELESNGYLTRERIRNAKGQMDRIEYILRESPISENPNEDKPTQEKPGVENPTLEKPILEKPSVENRAQYNTKENKNQDKEELKEKKNQENKESIRAREEAKEPLPKKIKYADDVLLTETEYSALIAKLGSKQAADECIEILSNYKGATGRKYKSDYKAILNWVVDKYRERHKTPTRAQPGTQNDPVSAAARVKALLAARQQRSESNANRYSS